jgi:O-antigen ligase
MGRKKPRTTGAPVAAATAPIAQPQADGAPPAVVILLAAAMLLAPALGVPNELMLQDTLKSIVVSFAALLAALLFFFARRRRPQAVLWHPVLVLPLLLMAYSLCSMAWSHAYLAGVEAIRWFVFALLLWLGLNTFSRSRLHWLAWGIHGGAVLASLWAALQFWVDWRFFPQGPPPASTFVNRNFFAEFVVCTLPFSVLLLARARQSAAIALLSASTALVIVAVLMTGTRAALMALWLQLLVVLPFILWRYRAHLAWSRWDSGRRALAAGLLLAGVVGLGLVPSGNDRLLSEGRGATPIERGLQRTASIGPNDASLGIRMIMWKATLRMVAEQPLTGVGAGAWEAEIPLYLPSGSQVETDYYVHNEVLQTLAEYGVAGALFLLGLFAWLLQAAWRTWRGRGEEATEEGAWRAIALCSLLALLLVSNVGFPWRMASTGALFALALAVVAASDARLGVGGRTAPVPLRWSAGRSTAALACVAACTVLASYITYQAAEVERKIVTAAKLAMQITASGRPLAPQWDPTKAQLLQLTREAIAINPHYRKITPLVADELAGWGDWRNAVWIWESVLASRPHVVAILTNVARAHTQLGHPREAMDALARAKAISPDAPSVRSLEVILLSRQGQEARAVEAAQQALREGFYDQDLLRTAVLLGWRTGDPALADRSLALLLDEFPATRVENLMLQAEYQFQALQDEARATESWRQALAAAPAQRRPEILARVPPPLRSRVQR